MDIDIGAARAARRNFSLRSSPISFAKGATCSPAQDGPHLTSAWTTRPAASSSAGAMPAHLVDICGYTILLYINHQNIVWF